MSDDIQSRIEDKLEEFAKKTFDAVETAKKENSHLQEEFTKQAEASAKALDELNALKDEKDTQDKRIIELEKKLARPSMGSQVDTDQKSVYNIALSRYLKKGKYLSDEVILEGVNAMTKKINPYMDEKETDWIRKDLVEGINPQGGYWIIPERSSQEVLRDFETSPIRQVANIMNTSVNEVQLIINDNEAANGGWVGETQARPITGTPDIGLLSIPIHEQYANPKASQRLLDDVSFDAQSWLVNKVTDRLTRGENTTFIAGDGASKPKGILAFPAWGGAAVAVGNDLNYARFELEQIKSGAAAALTYDGLVNLQNSLLEIYQPNAVFMMHRTSWGQILQLKASTSGLPFMNILNLLSRDTDRILLGKRVIFASDVPVVAAGSLSIIYGDFRMGYTIVDRFGFRVLRDAFTDKPNVSFYTTKRVGGTVTNYQSLKIQKVEA